jgi:hypothetical protein
MPQRFVILSLHLYPHKQLRRFGRLHSPLMAGILTHRAISKLYTLAAGLAIHASFRYRDVIGGLLQVQNYESITI